MKHEDIERNETEPSRNHEAALSRRSFVGLTVGAITMLPAVSGGFLSPFPAEKAYAADTASNTAKVVIAKSYEVGLIVADMADGKKVPVAGADITVESYFNKKSVSGTTNSSGCFLFDIRNLAQKQTVNGVDRYTFYAKIDVNAKGYRIFRARRISIEGARGVLIPTRKLGEDRLYPISISFDDWDVLYTKNEFAVTPANDTRHPLLIELACASNTPVTTRLVHTNTKKVLAEKKDVTPEYAHAAIELSEFFLLANHEKALPTTGSFHVEIDQGSRSYKVPLALSACAAPQGATVPSSTKMYLSPFNVGSMKPQIEIPKGVPIIGEEKLEVWTPDLDVEVLFNPFGYFKIAYKSEEWGYKSKDGQPDPNAWKSHPRKTFAEQWKKAGEARDKMMKSVGDARRREGVFKKAGFTSNLSATAMVAGMLAGRWSSDSGVWRGLLGVQGTLAFNFSYAQQFLAGPIPIVIEFSLNASLSLGLTVAVMTPEITSPSKYSMDYTNTGISLTFVISPSLSLGLGIKGVLTASIQGVASFTIFVNCGPIPKNATKEMTNPHVVLGVKAQANVVVQALIFTATHKLWEWDRPAFHDNWKPKLPTQEATRTQAKSGGETWETIFGNTEDISIIPEENIGADSEFEFEWEPVVTISDDDWKIPDGTYYENTEDEGWIFWGGGWDDNKEDVEDFEGEDESDGSFYWYDFDEDDQKDNETDFVYNGGGNGYIVYEDGSVAGWGSWGDMPENGGMSGQSRSTKSTKDAEPESTGPFKLEQRTATFKTDDDIPVEYSMTSFESVATQTNNRDLTVVSPNGSGASTKGAPSDQAAASDGDGKKTATRGSGKVFRRGTAKRKSGKIASGDTQVRRPASAPPAKLASDTGMVPQCDVKILESVFSDPRVKVVEFYGSSYLFRIAAVDIKSGGVTLHRTRIVAQKIVAAGQQAEPMRVLDFKHTYNDDITRLESRDDLFDYDFDIRLRVAGDYIAELDLFVISGKRPARDKTTISQAASDQVFTHAVCQFTSTNSRLEIKYGFSVKTSNQAFAATGKPDHKYHNFSCPHIIEIAKGEFVATYLDRAAATADQVLSKTDASVGLGVCFTTRYGNIKAANISNLIKALGGIADSSVYEMITLDPVSSSEGENNSVTSYIPVMLRGQEQTYHYLLATEATSVYKKLDRPAARVKSLKKLIVEDAQGNVPKRFVTWPGHNALLASVGGKLVKAELDTVWATLHYSEIGPSDFSISAFGTDTTGHFIYWPACYEGSPGFSYENAADDPEKATSLPEVERHRIMACKLRKGKFSDPFVFAEVSHDMDTLEVVKSQSGEAMAFISCDLRNVLQGRADIWYTSLPNVKCANIIGVEALSEIAYPGEPMVLHITVRNEGNTFLGGFTANIVEKGSQSTVAEVKLVFSKDTLVESGFNPAGDNGTLQDVEDDYSLAPGKTSVYQIKVNIPKTWTGEKSVSVIAKDVVLASAGSASTQSNTRALTKADNAVLEDYSFDDSNAVEYVVGTHADDFGTEGIPFDLVDIWAREDLDEYDEGYDDIFVDAPMQKAGDTANSDSSSTTKPTSTNTGSAAAKTGDPFGGMGGLLGVAAVAGAAMAAYSARRVANERAAAEGSSDDAPDTHPESDGK